MRIQDTNWYCWPWAQVFSRSRPPTACMQPCALRDAPGCGWAIGLAAGWVLRRSPAVPAGKAQGAVLLAGGILGLLALLAFGFTIGARGWSYEFLNQLLGELGARQPGMGWGAFVALRRC
jgi:iron(III) transport system permease protein